MNFQLQLDRAVGFHRNGDIAQAEPIYRQLLQVRPHPDIFYLLGVLCAQSEREKEALKNYDKALALQPGHIDALCGRGAVLRRLGRLSEALRSYDMAVTARPNHAEAFFHRGGILRDLNRLAEAVQSYDRALGLRPDLVGARNNRGVTLLDLQQFEAALSDFERVVSMTPGDADAHYNRSRALGELFRFDAALDSVQKALALNPDHIGALHGRGSVLWNMGRFEDALASYDRALAIAPHPATATSRANTLKDMTRLDEALAGHDQAIAMAPDHPNTHWNKSHCLLLMERFGEGFALFEWRKRLLEAQFPVLEKPEWLGLEEIAGKTLFVRAEQGFGDTLQFCRYVSLAQARGADVILGVQTPLARLMKSLTPPVETRALTNAPKHFDYHISLMSMPLAFGTTLDSIPSHVPYLHAELERVAHWAEKLGSSGFKVGISWRGGGIGLLDIGRSFPLRALESLGEIPGVRLISLQKKTGVEELLHLPAGMRVELLGEDFDEGSDAFVDSAAVMQNLDLVISSDTAIAHLAGALGRPVWLATKHVPDWRWLLGRADSPWYPTMQLFRQEKPGDWDGVFAQMHARLASMVGQG